MTNDTPVAVVDIDGVLADVRHRLHLVAEPPKDWEAFFAAAVDDPLLEEGAAMLQELLGQHDVVLLTGRPQRLEAATRSWLAEHGIPDLPLLMRPDGDRRPARIVKLEALRRLSRERRVVVLVDDDPQVCAAARSEGFACLEADWMGRPAVLTEVQEAEGRS